jgi:penicillin amidase
MSDWNEFTDAIKSFVSVSQNIVYADTAGNIGLYCSAGVPIRKGPAWEILPGETSEYDWKGMVPFDSLPHYYNPASEIAVSANNKTAPASYPYYISYWYDLPFRYNRIHQLLTGTDKHSVETFMAIQTDFYSDNVNFYLPVLMNYLEKQQWEGTEKDAITMLKHWDKLMDEGAEPAIYETFFMHLIRNLLEDELGEELYNEFTADKILVRQAIHRTWTTGGSSFTDNIATGDIQETLNDIVIQSFRDAVMELTNQSGKTEEWSWGRLHPLVVNHPMGTSKPLNFLFKLNRGPYATGGSFHTVAPYSYRYTKPFTATHGASHRHIYATGNWDESWTILPTGISGIPSSPYYCNQTDLYVGKKYRNDWFSRNAVVKNAKYSIVLKP